MKVYRLTLEPRSSFRTPLQSDTLFGHLMWALRYLEGKDALVAFLGRYRDGEPPPLLLSAGFPAGTLPLPVLAGGPPCGAKEGGSLADAVVGGILCRALEDERYLPLAQWQTIAGDLSPGTLADAREDARQALLALRAAERCEPLTRTAVHRITGSAREGQLFVAEETFYGPGQRLEVWHKLTDEADLPRLERWWRWVEANGFGRRKAAGHGALRLVAPGLVEAGEDLPRVAKPNGFVSLSAWVPRASDPTDVTYRTRIKRGKLAEAWALPGPWKKPLLMLEPGAVARLAEGQAVGVAYGRLVRSVHWTVEGVVQYGCAFPLPVRIARGA